MRQIGIAALADLAVPSLCFGQASTLSKSSLRSRFLRKKMRHSGSWMRSLPRLKKRPPKNIGLGQ